MLVIRETRNLAVVKSADSAHGSLGKNIIKIALAITDVLNAKALVIRLGAKAEITTFGETSLADKRDIGVCRRSFAANRISLKK